MNPLLMIQQQSLPKGNWLAIYDPYKQIQAGATSGQQLLDYSGNGNHATLGATSSVEASDPTFTTTSLSFDADAIVTLPSFADIDLTKKFTIATAFRVGTIGTKKYIWWRGVSGTGRIMLGVGTTGQLALTQYVSAYSGLLGPTVTATQDVLAIIRCDNQSMGLMVSNTKYTTSGTVALSCSSVGHALGYSGAAYFSGGLNHYAMFANRVWTDKECSQAYLYLKKLLAKRAINIA